MEAQQQQQQQHYHYQYQYQQPSTIEPSTTTLTTTPSYDPSQYQQSYDHQSSSYYQQQQQPQTYDYSSYYYQQQQQQPQQDYSTNYQTNDPNLIHPPGVPLTVVDSQQSHLFNPPNYYYPPSQSAFLPAGGPQAGRSVRGRGTFGRYGRGRGGGRGKPQTARSSVPSAPGGAQSAASTDGQAASSKPASRMAWCEVCRTDCTTFEVLEQHKNGKRHKKNLKVQAELLGLGRQLAASNPETVPSQNAEVSNANNPPSDSIGPEPTSSENKTDKPETSGPLPSQESVRIDSFAGRGGFKRKMRGGRGGKWMRTFDGSRRLVEPPKPKQVVPLICELCNVKCESQVVFESHITGKKHIANMKRFQGHKEVLGEGIQALYPSISHLLPSASIITQPNQQPGPQDAQALASMLLSQQNLQDPQAAQEALTQLLHQHGIHDAQTLIAQLLPYLLPQFQAAGSLPAQVAGLGIPAQNPVNQDGTPIPIGSESLNVTAENQTEQQAVTANVDSEVAPGTNDNPPTVA